MSFVRVGGRMVLVVGAVTLVASACQRGVVVHVFNDCDWAVEVQAAGDPATGHDYFEVQPGELRGLVTVEERFTDLDVWVRPVGDDGDGTRTAVPRDSDLVGPGDGDADFLVTLRGELCDGARQQP